LLDLIGFGLPVHILKIDPFWDTSYIVLYASQAWKGTADATVIRCYGSFVKPAWTKC